MMRLEIFSNPHDPEVSGSIRRGRLLFPSDRLLRCANKFENTLRVYVLSESDTPSRVRRARTPPPPTSPSDVSRSRRKAQTNTLVAGASRCSLASGRRERRKTRRGEKKLCRVLVREKELVLLVFFQTRLKSRILSNCLFIYRLLCCVES